MNFIKGILGVIDDVWSLWTIPAYILFAIFTISLFPILGLLILFMFIGIRSRYINYCSNLSTKYNTKSDNKYEDNYNPDIANKWHKKALSAQLDIFCAISVTIIITIILTAGFLGSHYEMCENPSIIPWSLLDILRTITTINC